MFPHLNIMDTSNEDSAVALKEIKSQSEIIQNINENESNDENGYVENNGHIENLINIIENDSISKQQRTDCMALKDVLRAIPERLTVKRKLKKDLLNRSLLRINNDFGSNDEMRHLSSWEYLCFNISIAISEIKTMVYNLSSTFELWYGSLKIIEGHFGSAVGTYFKFYRFLFLLNLIPFILNFTFLIFPQLLYEPKPKVLDNRITWKREETNFDIYDILTGKGYFDSTVLFYGFYSSEKIDLELFSYSIPKAYIFTIFISYLLTLIILCIYTTKSYCRCVIKSKGEMNHQFCSRVFSGWDYSIATQTAAKLHKEILHLEIKELLEEKKSSTANNGTYNSKKILTLTRRVILNFIFAMWMYLIVSHSSYLLHVQNDLVDNDSLSNVKCSLIYLFNLLPGPSDKKRALLYPVFVNCSLLLSVKVVVRIIKYEKFNNPRTRLYVNMVKMFIVEVVIVCLFLIYWFGYFHNSAMDKCWGTFVGQSIYQLLMINILLCILITFLYATFVGCQQWVGRKFNIAKLCKKSEFAIASSTFNLIHNQVWFWIGYFYSPVLTFLISVFMFVMFYIEKYNLMYIYGPPKRLWRSAQTQTFFLVSTFLSLLLIISVQGYVTFNIQTCGTCGPFKNVNYTYEEVFAVGNNENIFISYIKKPGIVFGILTVLCVNLYFMRAHSQTESKLVDTIHNILILQRKDKQFLAELLSNLMSQSTNGKDCLSIQRSLLAAKLQGIPGSPRTPYFTTNQGRKDCGNYKLLSRFITQHKTGLFM